MNDDDLLPWRSRQAHAVDEGWTITGPPEWTYAALCAQVDAEMFFPDKGGSTIDAKSICASCDVRAECLGYGIEDRFGIYGGLSERERRRLQQTGWRPGDEVPPIIFPVWHKGAA